MAVGLGASRAADEEARAEVEVLNSRLEKTSQLTKKIQASLNRLEASGKSLGDAIKPISGSTQRLQVLGNSNVALVSGSMW
jgi:exocyst complex protein 7